MTQAAQASLVSPAQREGLAASQRYRLPFGKQSWRGQIGAWHGAGVGSSIDFQDHRAYTPGDDPRYIHWAAYARTGQLTMKLYRAEVAPMVDIAVDVSASMTYDPVKLARTDALLAFCVASADKAGAPVRVLALDGRKTRPVPVESVRMGRWRENLKFDNDSAPKAKDGKTEIVASAPPTFASWRTGAMKVLVCDLLFPGDPAPLLTAMSAAGGLALVLAPATTAESEPPGRGNVELVDCESGVHRHQRIDERVDERYREAYARHFALWDDAARRRGVMLVRVPCEGTLVDVLGQEPYRSGAVEVSAR